MVFQNVQVSEGRGGGRRLLDAGPLPVGVNGIVGSDSGRRRASGSDSEAD